MKTALRGLLLALMATATGWAAGPTITNLAVTATTATTVTIQWTTSAPANGQLLYGTTTLSSATPVLPALVTSHTITLTGLTDGSSWNYAAVSANSGGSTTSATQQFTICATPGNGLANLSGNTNNYYEYGTYAIAWQNTSGQSVSPTLCGVALTTTYTGNLDRASSLSLKIPSTLAIVPSPSSWQITETGINGSIGSFTATFDTSKSSTDISSALAAAALGNLIHVWYDVATSTFYPAITGIGTVTAFTVSGWPAWLTPTVTNSTTTPNLSVAASAIPNSALQYSSTTVNSQTCTLGSSCTITATASGSAGGDLSGTYPDPTVAKVDGVSYGATPGTNTVPVVTGSNTVTYEAVPNTALANSSTTVNSQTCTLGGSCTVTVSGFTGNLAGDVTGAQSTTTVGKLENIALPTLAAVTGLLYDTTGTLSLPSTLPTAAVPAFSGDISNTAGSLTTTLATVNSGPGTCGTASAVCQITTNGKGLVTAQSAVSLAFPTTIAAVTHKYLTSYTSTTTLFTSAQPVSADLSDLGTANGAAQLNGSGQLTLGELGSGTPVANDYVDGAAGAWTALPVSSITTVGTSGVATLVSGVLNIPQYAGSGSGMTWPASAGIAVYAGASVWGTSLAIAASTGIVYDTAGTLSLAGTLPTAAVPAFTGDVSNTAGSLTSTLATVNANIGSFGSSTAIPNFTVNGKGLMTAAGSNVVIAPAGTLTGTTLASNVVTSSLTAVGIITSGTWNGTAITNSHLQYSSTTVNSQTCTLGGSCTVTSSGFTGSLAGDVTGTQSATTVGKLENIALPTLAAATGLLYDTAGTLSLPGTLPTAAEPAHTGDATNTAGSLALTLATVNTTTGTFGSSTAIPTFTVNGKGLMTYAATTTVTAAALNITATSANATFYPTFVSGTGAQTVYENSGLTYNPSTGALTTPILYGGSGASSTLTLDGTSNGSPSNAYVLINPAGQGNVGIGTATPGALLDITGNIGSGGSLTFFHMTDSNSVLHTLGIGANTGRAAIGTLTNNDFAIFTNNGADNIRVQAGTGNVGIGTTAPRTLLEVNGAAIVDGVAVVGQLQINEDAYSLPLSAATLLPGQCETGLAFQGFGDNKAVFVSSLTDASGNGGYIANMTSFAYLSVLSLEWSACNVSLNTINVLSSGIINIRVIY